MQSYLLLGDVGGTKAQLELRRWDPEMLTIDDDDPPLAFTRTRTVDHPSVQAIVEAFLAEATPALAATNGRVRLGVLAVCGPVDATGRADLIGPHFGASGWVVEAGSLGAALGFEVAIINDFEAVGTSLPVVPRAERAVLHAPNMTSSCGSLSASSAGATAAGTEGDVFACLGPGTGLGECFGVWQSTDGGGSAGGSGSGCAGEQLARRGHYKICCSEGGMSDFAARTADEWACKRWLAARAEAPPPMATPPLPPPWALSGGDGFVEVERVVSGAGIANCYRWAVAAFGPVEGVDEAVAAEVAASPEPAGVIARHGSPTTVAHKGGDGGAGAVVEVPPRCGLCRRAVDMFLFALGGEAANLALRYQATGGVFIAGGGVGPKLLFGLRRATELGHCAAAGGGGGDAASCQSLVVAGYLTKVRSWPAYAATCPLVAVATSGDALALQGVAEVAARHMRARGAAAR